MNIDIDKIVEIAKAADRVILDVYNSSDVKVEVKDDKSPVTIADKAASELIVTQLQALYPQIPVISEELPLPEFDVRRKWSYYFLVDPLDGTKEFLKKTGNFTVNIALIDADGRSCAGVVTTPVTGDVCWAVRGQGAFCRRPEDGSVYKLQCVPFDWNASGLRISASKDHRNAATEKFLAQFKNPKLISAGSSIKFLMIAKGQVDLYPRLAPTSEWDTAAAQIILEEAGGKVWRLNSDGSVSSDERAKHAVSTLMLDPEEVTTEEPHAPRKTLNSEALQLQVGWIREVAQRSQQPTRNTLAQLPGSQDSAASSNPPTKHFRREYAFYCTPKGMVPGMLAVTDHVITFEPDRRSPEVRRCGVGEFQTLIPIGEISEIAAVVLPRTAAIETLFNLPQDQQLELPSWASRSALDPAIGLLQILLKARRKSGVRRSPDRLSADSPRFPKSQSVELRSPRSAGQLSRRRSAARLVDMTAAPLRRPKRRSAPLFDTQSEEQTRTPPPQRPRSFVLFRVSSTEVVREVTRLLLGIIDEYSARHGQRPMQAYVPFYSNQSLDVLMNLCLDTEWPEVRRNSWMFRSAPPKLELRPGARPIFSHAMVIQLSAALPPTVALRKWKLLFDTDLDGISLLSFYRQTAGHQPALLILKDEHDCCFGGYNPKGFYESRHYYGNGETFVFRFRHNPRDPHTDPTDSRTRRDIDEDLLDVYGWSGANDFFIYSDHERIVFGGGGSFAFAIDADLLQGNSSKCQTFMNELLTPEEDFTVREMQVWGFEQL